MMFINIYSSMKILIIYDSLFGNTQKIAEAIEAKFSLVHESKVFKVGSVSPNILKEADALIIGSPTHGGRPTDPIKKLIHSFSKDMIVNRKVATFDTSFPTKNMGFFINKIVKFFGNASYRLSNELSKKGANVIDSKIFYVLGKEGPLQEGEIEKAQLWVETLNNLLK